jgi:hypothetical protein
VHLQSALSTEPYVLSHALITASLIANVDVQPEKLAFMMMTGGGTPAIGTFADHNTSCFGE